MYCRGHLAWSWWSVVFLHHIQWPENNHQLTLVCFKYLLSNSQNLKATANSMSIIFYLNILILEEINALRQPRPPARSRQQPPCGAWDQRYFCQCLGQRHQVENDWSTWRKPTGTWGEHANSTKKGPDPDIRTFLRWGKSSNHRTSEPLSSAQFRRHHLSQKAVQSHSFIGFKSRLSQSAIKQTNKMNSGDRWAIRHTQKYSGQILIYKVKCKNNMINKQ